MTEPKLDRLMSCLAAQANLYSTCPNWPMGALFIAKSGAQVLGFNSNKTHPKSNSRFKRIHAEFDAIRHAVARKIDIHGGTLYVARYQRTGGFGLAKPCAFCMEMIEGFRIKKVAWSAPDGPKELFL